MTASRPKNPPLIFRDQYNLYLQWPIGPPVRFPFSDSGLQKALDYVPMLPTSGIHLSGGRNIIEEAKAKVEVSRKTRDKRAVARASPELKRKAWEIVRKNLLGYNS